MAKQNIYFVRSIQTKRKHECVDTQQAHSDIGSVKKLANCRSNKLRQSIQFELGAQNVSASVIAMVNHKTTFTQKSRLVYLQ
jgi:hypothetical protein